MKNIVTLKAEAYKIITRLKCEDVPEAGYVYNAEIRLKAMEVYAMLISAEQANKKESTK